MREQLGEIKSIIVAVDGSEQSNNAVRLASRIAASFGAEMTLLHVMDMRDMPSLIAETEDRGEEAHGQSVLSDSAELAMSQGITAKTELRKGHAVGQILRFAAEQDPQMIFIGTRGLGRGAALIMGSVSKAVVQGAKTTVVVVR